MGEFVLSLAYTEIRTGGQVIDPHCAWPSYETAYISVSFDSLSRLDKHMWNHEVDVTEDVYNSDEVYMTVHYYSDGDTFSSTEGYWEILGIYKTYQEAKDASDEFPRREGFFGGTTDVVVHKLMVQN